MSNNPDVCFQCGIELGPVIWPDHKGAPGVSRQWIEHYNLRHPEKKEDLEIVDSEI